MDTISKIYKKKIIKSKEAIEFYRNFHTVERDEEKYVNLNGQLNDKNAIDFIPCQTTHLAQKIVDKIMRIVCWVKDDEAYDEKFKRITKYHKKLIQIMVSKENENRSNVESNRFWDKDPGEQYLQKWISLEISLREKRLKGSKNILIVSMKDNTALLYSFAAYDTKKSKMNGYYELNFVSC